MIQIKFLVLSYHSIVILNQMVMLYLQRISESRDDYDADGNPLRSESDYQSRVKH